MLNFLKIEFMIRKKIKQFCIISFSAVLLFTPACSQNSGTSDKAGNKDLSSANSQLTEQNYKVTFIELGSVRCIPCQQMQPVMKSIETKYSKDVKVVFHDVWTEAGKPYGVKYGIEAIPTQIFLDESGKEYYRHIGFFPEEELVKILQLKGVVANQIGDLL
jgi:thioredoxin 1